LGLAIVVLLPVGHYVWKLYRSEPAGRQKAPRPEDVPELTRQLGDPIQRMGALLALAELGPEAKSAVPAVIRVLDDKSANLERAIAVRILGRIGAGDPSTVPALCRALTDRDLDVQIMAINTLAEMGTHAKDAIPALNTLKDDEESPLGAAAAEALKKIRGEEAKP